MIHHALKQKSKIASRARIINISFLALLLVLISVILFTTIRTINDNTSMSLVKAFSVEASEKFSHYISHDLALTRKTALSRALTNWFTDEANELKKSAAFDEIADYSDLFQGVQLYFGINESLNEYSIEKDTKPEDFIPFDIIDPSNPADVWYYECLDSANDYSLKVDSEKRTDDWYLWINHKVMVNGEVEGVLASGLEIPDIFREVFERYENREIIGYIIDKNGYILMSGTESEIFADDVMTHIIDINSEALLIETLASYQSRINGLFETGSQSETIKLPKSQYKYAAVEPIIGTDWSVVIFYKSDVLSSIADFLPLLIVLLSALLLYVAAADIMTRRIFYEPLNRLTKNISEGNSDGVDFFVKSRDDEIGGLAQTIRELWDRLAFQGHWYKSILDATPFPITVTDADMNWTFVNKAVEDFLGTKLDDMAGKPCSNWNAHICKTPDCGIACAKRGQKRTYFSQEGKSYQVDVEILKDLNGETAGFIEVVQDITDIKTAVEKSEAAVREIQLTRRTLDAMFEANPQINILFDNSLKIVDCNPAAYEFMRFDTKEKMLEGFMERLTQTLPKYQEIAAQVSTAMGERLVTAVKDGISKFETEIIIGGELKMLNAEFKRIPYGDSFAVVGYIFDMTDIHKRELELLERDKQLHEAVEEAIAANRSKSAFLASMSHEIRTPMNAILGISEIQLQKENLAPDIIEALNKIYNSGNLLLGIINDILDLSKIEAGKLELIPAEYKTASLINDTVSLNMMRIGSKPIEFKLSIDENLPASLYGDELRIKQILNNVLSNAIKYTKAGEVKFSVSADDVISNGKENSGVVLVFSAADTGQGMTEEQVSKLFDEYSRFNMEANRTTEGTGLGMSITRNLISMMNGKISVESEAGKGSVFTIRIPQIRTGSGVLGKELAESLEKFKPDGTNQAKRTQVVFEPMPYGKILVTDDVEANLYVAAGLMAPYLLSVDTAASGFEAIDKIKEGNIYDIVFMDHMMPVMDGIETVKNIRELGYREPVIALTANAVVGQSDVFLANGFDGFISKPIDIRQLNSILKQYVRDKQPPEVIEAALKQNPKKEAANETPQPLITPHFAEITARDINKAITALETILEKNGDYNEDDIRLYTVNTHGMKSALANIGETELSAVGLKLEKAGREKDTGVIKNETPAFIEELRKVTEKLSVFAGSGAETESGTGETGFLNEKLRAIKEACEAFDKKTAKNALSELRKKTWEKTTGDLLAEMDENLLNGDFDEVIRCAEKILENGRLK